MKYSIIIVAIVFNLLVACSQTKNTAADEQKNIPEVECANPQIKTLNEYIVLNGVTSFLQKEVVRSTVTGYITEVFPTMGEHIVQNQKLFAVKTSEAYAMNSVKDTNLFTRSIFIKSNKSGILSALHVQQGTYTQQGDVLAEITQPENLVIQVNVPYENNDVIKLGKACQLVLPDGKQLPATIFRIMPLVDKMSQTQSVFVKLSTYSELPENLNVIISILKRSKDKALSVPNSAVLTNETQDKFWLMKLVNDTLAVEVPITKGIVNDSETEILTPILLPNDIIITKGAYGLPDSSVVKKVK